MPDSQSSPPPPWQHSFPLLRSRNLADSIENGHEKAASSTPPSAPPACTFMQLYTAFGPSLQDDTTSFSSCWSLEDRILRVPVSSVHDSKDAALGKGSSGGVYQATLQVPSLSTKDKNQGDAAPMSFCTVAVKTDHCFDTNEEHSLENKNQARSCLSSKSTTTAVTALRNGASLTPSAEQQDRNLKVYKSFLQGEYTGALPWYAQFLTGEYQDGLIPTWGLIVDEEEEGGKTMGVIMPLQPMAMSLQKYMNTPTNKEEEPSDMTTKRTMEPLRMARAMLPVVKGVAFLADMGLAHQDIHEKNIGLVKRPMAEKTGDDEEDDYRAVLFDNSYLSVVPRYTKATQGDSLEHKDHFVCSLDGTNPSTCNYCPEPLHFPHPQREQAWREGLGPIGSDMTRLRFIMLQLMEGSSVSTKNNHNSVESVEALGLEQALRECTTAHELATVLQNFINGNML